MRFTGCPIHHQRVLQAGALRFDGYGYVQVYKREGDGWLWDIAQQFVDTHTLHLDQLENWSALFSLQRRLGREQISSVEEERAFLKLFLHLYQEPTPTLFIHTEYQQQWERHADQREDTAQWVRAELSRQGAG